MTHGNFKVYSLVHCRLYKEQSCTAFEKKMALKSVVTMEVLMWTILSIKPNRLNVVCKFLVSLRSK